MKKTRFFIFITALLITLLIVVGCDVSPVSDSIASSNPCIEFKLSVAGPNSREIKIDSSNVIIKNYRIALIPEWDVLENGTPAYGQIGSRSVDGVVSYGETTYSSIDQISLGYVTPGKWTVYVAAFNNDNKVVLDGYTSTYVNSSENTVSVCLSPNVTTVSESGTLNFYIFVPKLSESHLDYYVVNYTVFDSKNGKVSSGDITGYDRDFNSTQIWYYDYEGISLPAGEYIIRISLYDKNDNSSIGGITKKISIVSGSTTTVGGSLSPSEFVDANLESKLPVINADVDDNIDLAKQVKDSVILFKCSDKTNPSLDGYTVTYRWFIDGELITKVTTDEDYNGKWRITAKSDNDINRESSISCVFDSYGKHEIRCEVVYIPSVTEGVDNSTLMRLVGGDSTFVEIIPRKTL